MFWQSSAVIPVHTQGTDGASRAPHLRVSLVAHSASDFAGAAYCCPTLSLRPFAMYVAFLRSDSSGPFDCLQGLGAFGTGLPCLLPTLLRIPCRLSRVHRGELKRDAGGGVFLHVPSTPCGSLVVIWARSGLPLS